MNGTNLAMIGFTQHAVVCTMPSPTCWLDADHPMNTDLLYVGTPQWTDRNASPIPKAQQFVSCLPIINHLIRSCLNDNNGKLPALEFAYALRALLVIFTAGAGSGKV